MAPDLCRPKVVVFGDIQVPAYQGEVDIVALADVEALAAEMDASSWPLVVFKLSDLEQVSSFEGVLLSVACESPEEAVEASSYSVLPLWDPSAAAVAFQSALSVRRRLEDLDGRVRRTEADHEAFVHAVSHDLKGPLQGIIGLSGLLMEQSGVRVFPEVGAYATRIENEADRLAKMISALTAFTRLGGERPRIKRVDLSALIDQLSASAIRNYTERFPRFQVSKDIPEVEADEGLLSLALDALLDNAVRFTESGPVSLVIGVEHSDDDRCVLTFQDAGMGIPEHALESVFELFTRLDRRRSEGVGVGLTMARKALELCGGRLWLTSAPGAGTKAHLELVLAR